MTEKRTDAPGVELGGCVLRRAEAATQFNQHQRRDDGLSVVNSLCDGFTIARDLLFTRVHDDVETQTGRDSMLIPVSPAKSERMAKIEIEIFQVVESAVTADERKYLGSAREWCTQWLLRLRLGPACSRESIQKRAHLYLEKDHTERALFFSDVLVSGFPEAGKAPLVLLKLFPLTVDLVTARAFGDQKAVDDVRARQLELLPSISDCTQCHGQPLPNGETCRECGNPVWKFRWLTTV